MPFKLSNEARRIGLALLLLFVLALVLYHKPASGRYIFAGPDDLAPRALGAGIARIEAETGEFPLWQPGILAGMPTLHALTGIARFYLPQFLAVALHAVGLESFWFFLLHLIFGGMGSLVLLRSLKVSWGGSLLGGTGFMLMPYFNTMLVHGHGNQMMTLAYLPWVVWALLRLYRRADLSSAAVLALLIGLQFQRAHVQISYYIMMMAGLLFLIGAVNGLRDKERDAATHRRFMVYAGLAIIVGTGMALSLLLPVLSYTALSERGATLGGGGGLDYATQWSFSFGETMTFLLPSFFGFGGATYWGAMPSTDYPNYMGIILLFLALWAPFRTRNWITVGLAAGGLLAYLLSMGHNFFLYGLFYELLPFFNKFRAPSMLLVLTQFSVVILAGIGLDGLLDGLSAAGQKRRRNIVLAAGLMAGALLVIFVLTPAALADNLPETRGVSFKLVPRIQELRVAMLRGDVLWYAFVMASALGSLLAWQAGALKRRWFLGVIIALSVIDLARVDQKIIAPARGSFRSPTLRPKALVTRYLNSDTVIEFLQSDEETFRIFPLKRLRNGNRWAAFGLESIGGYHPGKLANYERFRSGTQFRSAGTFKMLNVKYLVSPDRFSDDRFEQVFEGSYFSGVASVPVVVYRYKDHLPRAWFPGEVVALPDSIDVVTRLAELTYDPAEVVYVREAGLARQGNGAGRVKASRWNPDHIRLELELADSALLVVSEVYYPKGWVARIDGEEVPIVEVNGLLRGVMVPAGGQVVTLDFEPLDVRLGRWLARLFTLVVVAGFGVGWWRSRSEDQRAEGEAQPAP
ncbi:MAG: hypothetical protein IH971_02010 [Candidatus Marinimicrobia bacterium]|nr:hypothetical protein [Candidatus Neomarinimicrobiota bacterium]